MLATHPLPGSLRRADNLLPTARGTLAARPGATQVVAGDVTHAQPWGNRIVFARAGRLLLWDGVGETDLGPAGRVLQVAPFAALTQDAAREPRLYVADGVFPLWYLAYRAGVWASETVRNSVLDAQGAPYDIPVPQTLANWRGRLWAGFGGNRVQHCQFDAPDEWDPLWTVEFQGRETDRVTALADFGETLRVGLTQSLWAVSGDSQYNWQRDRVAPYGASGPDALARDQTAFYWLSSVGLHRDGTDAPLAEAVSELFAAVPSPGALALDRRRRLLLALVAGRLLAMHLEQPGKFGEIAATDARGLLALEDYTGWYGAGGIWLLGARDRPDRALDGTRTSVTSVYETWPSVPNPNGRALLARAEATLSGSARGTLAYTAVAVDPEGGREEHGETATMADEAPDLWSDALAGLDGERWPSAPVQREFCPYLSGTTFWHRLAASAHVEIERFEPDYRYAPED